MFGSILVGGIEITPSRKSRMEKIPPHYCGDEFLESLITTSDTIKRKGWDEEYRKKYDRALIASLFLTGGRATEVLKLRTSSFDFQNKEATNNDAFLVKEFVLMKRGTKEKRLHVTHTFPIWYDDPLVGYLREWIDEMDGRLFPSQIDKNSPLSYDSLRKYVIKIGRCLDNAPFITPEYFRRQRELHLAEKRGFTLSNIKAYFNLKKILPTPTKREEWQNLLVIAKNFREKTAPKKSEEKINPLIDLLPIAKFLDIDQNWMLAVIALQLQEIAIKKTSDKMGINLDRRNIEKILNKPISLEKIPFMPYNIEYTAFAKEVKNKTGSVMPKLVQDLRRTRANVLHEGYNPTREETDTIMTFTRGFLEKLKTLI
jgi:hypothetical protein